jgi:hypothetical protein
LIVLVTIFVIFFTDEGLLLFGSLLMFLLQWRAIAARHGRPDHAGTPLPPLPLLNR